jgi:hypothetical protein
VIKNLQKASAFHHCHYTKETLLRQQKTDSLKKKHKNCSLNMCRVPIYFGIRKKESGVLCCGVLFPSDAPEIESDKSFPFRGLRACGGEAFLYACGAGTAGYQPDCTKRIAQN